MIQKMCGLGVMGCVLCLAVMAQADVISFEDVNLPPESYWNGTESGLAAYTTGPVTFTNGYDAAWDWWMSWLSVSNITDRASDGFTSQYHAIPGQGASGSPNYGISFSLDELTLDQPTVLSGVYLTNNNYTYYSMARGDDFSKKFGGPDGNDADWFLLTIAGEDANGVETGKIDFYLADFRFEDSSLDYIVSDWTFVDLRPLGEVKALTFSFASSDTGDWGMNTPAYFAMDNLILPDAAPYAQAGVPGFEDADQQTIHPIFRGWATDVAAYGPAGQLDIMGTSYADATHALGAVDHTVVSLGDLTEDDVLAGNMPGFVTVVFGDPCDVNDTGHIRNQAGYDFVVFENGITSMFTTGDALTGQLFAELAWVEVSSNGTDFVRFPNSSLTEEPMDRVGTLDPDKVRNLAGVHPNTRAACLGTPFDLEDLSHTQAVMHGLVDVNDIRFVRLVDVPGYGGFADSEGHPIYDPTGGWTNGFDLDAVGVLHAQAYSGDINLDGLVDAADQTILTENLGLHFGQTGWLARTDLNKDWKTDQADLTLLTEQLGSEELWHIYDGQ
ncbi:MAG: DUF4465 domain-containing protein [Phycisphaerae bacterium]|nr:DUF4465 domain-containing protein [Phycisphaerae bacterium]